MASHGVRSAPNSPENRRRTGSRRSAGEDSRDEEHRTGELMGEWLSGLPPTMPFHRGQVLIIPQSPYQQKLGNSKSPRKGATTPRLGSKARTDMIQLETDDEHDRTRRDTPRGGGRDDGAGKKVAAEDEEEGAEKPEKERLVYISPVSGSPCPRVQRIPLRLPADSCRIRSIILHVRE